MTTRRRWVRWTPIGVAFVVFVFDQYVKNWVVSTLPEGESVPVLGEFLQWHFVRNPGAAFSLASGATWIFTILASLVVVVIIWQMRRLGSRSWAIFLGLLLGGTVGNLFDRLTRDPGFPVGHVIDFIYTPWMMPAIYNIADIAIVSSMVIFVLVTLLGLPIDGSPRVRRGEDSPADADSPCDAAEDTPDETAEDTPDETAEQDPASPDETPETEEPR